MQYDEAVSGLQYTTELLVRCKNIEDTYILPSEDADQRYPPPILYSFSVAIDISKLNLNAFLI
jgi:hypothetical protein